MNKKTLYFLIGVCLVSGMILASFGIGIWKVVGLGLFILAWILIPRYQVAMPRLTKIERIVRQKGVERRKRLGLKMFVGLNRFKKKRESSCPVTA